MAIVGSVVDTETVVTLTETAETVTFPQAGLNVVGIVHNAAYVKVAIDSSRVAVFPNAGGFVIATPPARVNGLMRRINFVVTGTVLNYSILTKGTSTTVCFYYGTPLTGAKPLTAYAGVTASSTLSSGAGTATLTFPSGPLTMTGFTAVMQLAAASTVLQSTWNIESGKAFNAFILAGTLTANGVEDYDVIPLELTVSQTVAVTISLGTGSDVVILVAYYQYV